MFGRVIVATDLSDASFEVLKVVPQLKLYGAQEILLLQCLTLQETASTALSYSTDHLEKILNRQMEILQSEGLSVETRNVVGHPRKEVNRLASEEEYSLIVVGSQGHSITREAILGGEAYGIIHNARKPVLLVPVHKAEESDKCKLVAEATITKNVLFPTDFSANADSAFTFLETIAPAMQNVTLFHVQDKARIEKRLEHRLEEFNEIDKGRLESMKNVLMQKSNIQIDTDLRYGFPAAEILHFTREKCIDFVVMASQGRGFLGELFWGSVSHKVARSSDVPVLLIPSREL